MSVKGYRFVSPGIFLKEIDQSVLTPTRPERGPALIGRFKQGPGMRPVVVSSYQEFSELFGDPHAGGSSRDGWRGDAHGGPTYSAYAAEAWLQSGVAPVTIVRLMGTQNGSATTAGYAGWDTKNSSGTSVTHVSSGDTNVAAQATNGGAFGLFIAPSASVTDANQPTSGVTAYHYTGSLAAVWYLTEGSIELTGTLVDGSTVTSGSAQMFQSMDTNFARFKAVIRNSAGQSVKEAEFHFDSGVDGYIRNQFNTDPTRTNGSINSSADRLTYWLGESFEQSLDELVYAISSSAGDQVGFVAGLGNSNAEWQQHREAFRDGRTGWFISQDVGAAASYNALDQQKLFRFIGMNHGEWLQNNYKVSIENIKRASHPNKYAYGTFDVVVRPLGAKETPGTATEIYSSCTLDPDSDNYIAKLIGDRYVEWDSDKLVMREYGTYDNMSSLIRIEMNEQVDRGNTQAELLPFGVFGPPRFRSFAVVSGSTSVYDVVDAVAATGKITTADGDDATANQFTEGEYVKMTAADGTVGIFILSDASETDAVASGTILDASSDLGTGTPSATLLAEGTCIAVRCNLNSNSQATVLNEFKDTLNSATSPLKDKITTGTITGTGDGIQSITFTQATTGDAGNTTITTDISQFTVSGFSGGADHRGQNAIVTGTTGSAFTNAFIDASGSIPVVGLANFAHTAGKDVPEASQPLLHLGLVPYSASFDFPAPKLIKIADKWDANYHRSFGVDWSRQKTRGTEGPLHSIDRSLKDVARHVPSYYTSYVDDPYANDMEYAWVFTLDDIQLEDNAGPSSATSEIQKPRAYYVSGSRQTTSARENSVAVRPDAAMRSWTAASGAFSDDRRGLCDMGYNRFTTMFHGGHDGLDLQEAEPFRNTFLDDCSGDRTLNYAYNTVMRAAEILQDPEYVEFNILSMPGLTERNLTDKLLSVCEDRADALAIIDIEGGFVPRTESSDSASARRGNVTTIVSNLKSREADSSYGCAYYPWVQVQDSRSKRRLWLPPSAIAVGVLGYSQAIENNAPWFAPAGFKRGGLDSMGSDTGAAGLKVLNVHTRLTSEQRDDLYEHSINPIAKFPAEGIVVFGQKTLQAVPSALDRINVRRLLLHVKKEISIIAATILFEPNVSDTWAKFKSAADTFLEGVKANYGLTDYLVKLDETTTTDDLIDRNILYAQVYLKPARAIEFIAIDFIITKSGASFED